jgi:hypothetical protein
MMYAKIHQLSAPKLLGIVGAFVLIAALVPLQMASGETPPAPIPFEAGQLRLHMNTDASWFKYFDGSNTQIGGTQSFSAGTKCNYVQGSNGNLLMAPSATSNLNNTVVGYLQKDNGYGLGVNRGGKEGTGSCTQTNLTGNEKLTLELQNDTATSPVHGLYVSSTALDMEFKYNATLVANFWLDGKNVGSNTYNCLGSDCGPDSGGGDNYVVELVPPTNGPNPNPNLLWDKVEFTVSSSNSQAAVTLEGGNDVNTSTSIFNLVQFLTPASCDNPIEGSGGGTHVTIQLLPESGVCPDKGYSLSVTAREINFETLGGASSQWIVNVDDWSPEPAINPVPATVVYPPAGGEDAVWCDGTFNANDPGGTFGASMPAGGHSWCLIRQNTTIAGEVGGVQQMQVNELYLLEGDARLCRSCA